MLLIMFTLPLNKLAGSTGSRLVRLPVGYEWLKKLGFTPITILRAVTKSLCKLIEMRTSPLSP